MIEPHVKFRWLDEQTTAEVLLRAAWFSVKRTRSSRIVNLATDLIMLPIVAVNMLVIGLLFVLSILIFLPRAVYLTVVAKVTVGTVLQAFSKVWFAVSKADSFFPTALIAKAVSKAKDHELLRPIYDNRPNILYLRPFRMDRRLALVPGDTPLALEAVIRAAINRIGPMIALGNSEGKISYRAGRIQTRDSDWKSEAVCLLGECRHIIVVPENTEGTLWELDQILTTPKYLAKTVFLNINSAGRDHPIFGRERRVYSDDDGKTFARTLQRIVDDRSTEFPPLDEIVCAFLLDNVLNLVCAKELIDSGRWGQSATLAIYLMLKSEAGESS